MKEKKLQLQLECRCGFISFPTKEECLSYSKNRNWPTHCGFHLMRIRWVRVRNREDIKFCNKSSCKMGLGNICHCEECEGKFHGVEKWRNFHLEGTVDEWKLTSRKQIKYQPYF